MTELPQQHAPYLLGMWQMCRPWQARIDRDRSRRADGVTPPSLGRDRLRGVVTGGGGATLETPLTAAAADERAPPLALPLAFFVCGGCVEPGTRASIEAAPGVPMASHRLHSAATV
jgi:hypothetical protein